MIVVNRFRVDASDGAQAEEFRVGLHAAHRALAGRPGYVAGHAGRNVDDPDLWVLVTTWADTGSYRRALSSYDVKVTAVPLLSRALDEPSAYELDDPGNGTPLNEARPRGIG